MLINYLTFSLLFLSLVLGCHIQSTSELDREGFYGTSNGDSLNIASLAAQLSMDLKVEHTLEFEEMIATTAAATFRFICQQSDGNSTRIVAGSAVFIGEDGHFITSSHSLSSDAANCRLRTGHVDRGILHLRDHRLDLQVDATLLTVHRWNLTVGQVMGLKNTSYLPIANTSVSASGRLLSFGFPGKLQRNGTETDREDFRELHRANCNLNQIDHQNRLEYSEADAIDEQEHQERAHLLEKLCSHGEAYWQTQSALTPRQETYPTPSSNNYDQLFISVGQSIFEDEWVVLADNDLVLGMNGGPLVNMAGELVAIAERVGVPNGNDALYYPAAGVWQKVSTDRLTTLRESGSVSTEGCLCQAEASRFGIPQFSSPLILPKNGACSQYNTPITQQRRRLDIENCMDATIHSQVWRLGDTLRVVTTQEEEKKVMDKRLSLYGVYVTQ